MLNNYFTIRETANYLKANISGYVIKEIYTQEKNKLLIEVISTENDNSRIIEFSIEKDLNYILLKRNYSRAKKNFALLFEEIYDKEISDIKIFNDDRAISFAFGENMEMIFTFFSIKANCFLADNKIVINSFKEKDEYLRKLIEDILPVRTESSDEVTNYLTIAQFLRLSFRKYGSIYQKEVLYNIKLNDKDTLNEEKLIALKKGFEDTDKKLKNPEFLLYSKDRSFQMSLISLNYLEGYILNKFDDINELISEFIKNKFRIEKTDSLKNKAEHDLKQKISNIDKKIRGINIQLHHCEDSDNLRKEGDIILQNIHLLNKGDKTFKYKNIDGSKHILKLKEDLSPSENARYYFDKYKKQKGSVDILRSRIINFEKEKLKLESELGRIHKMTEYKTLLKEEKRSEENRNDETSRFRKFRLNDKYEVWVGKDSASNDLLTTKYTAQNDLWFHVRGSSGSHTVLKINNKKEDIEKESILRAASIAAYYSKARNASNVPVAYCEKKYVKKKKGFKQGSVVMEREKVIFVKPKLPE